MSPEYKFLIVDDNQIDQVVTSQLLKSKLGVTDISKVNTGKEAIHWLNVTPLKKWLIILLDIRMPEMDGFQFLEEFAKMARTTKENTTIFMLSSTLDDSDIQRAKDHPNVKSILSKPLPTGKLAELIS